MSIDDRSLRERILDPNLGHVEIASIASTLYGSFCEDGDGDGLLHEAWHAVEQQYGEIQVGSLLEKLVRAVYYDAVKQININLCNEQAYQINRVDSVRIFTVVGSNAIATQVTPVEWFTVEGYGFFIVQAPDGYFHVAELESGILLGRADTIEKNRLKVSLAIAGEDPDGYLPLIHDARHLYMNARQVTPTIFWQARLGTIRNLKEVPQDA